MVLKLLGGVLLFASLFSVVSPPSVLGSHGRKKGVVGALAAFVLLIALREGSSETSKEANVAQTAVATAPPVQRPSPEPSSPPRRPTPPTTDLRQSVVDGEHREVVRVSAMSLFREYDQNEVATDMRLKGKIVEINGRVTAINKDFMDVAYVELQTPNQFMSATVRPINSDIDKVSRLRKNQLVTFRCEKMERFMGSPSGKKCMLVD